MVRVIWLLVQIQEVWFKKSKILTVNSAKRDANQYLLILLTTLVLVSFIRLDDLSLKQ